MGLSIYNIEVPDVSGQTYKLEKYKGHPMLIVNTATKCGLAGQFDELEKIYQEYKEQGLVVLGFPSNQFKQETSTGLAAAESCRLTYGVTFPMHDIVKVNGSEAHPLFKLLTEETKGILGKSIKWNFTKFLVDAEGNIVKRFAPTDKPSSFKAEIEKVLK